MCICSYNLSYLSFDKSAILSFIDRLLSGKTEASNSVNFSFLIDVFSLQETLSRSCVLLHDHKYAHFFFFHWNNLSFSFNVRNVFVYICTYMPLLKSACDCWCLNILHWIRIIQICFIVIMYIHTSLFLCRVVSHMLAFLCQR